MNDRLKIKLLAGSTVALILLNIGLVCSMWYHPSQPRAERGGRNRGEIIIHELQLDSAQRMQFDGLKHEHQHIMARVNIRDRHTHEALFNLIKLGQDSTAASDSLINEIAENKKQIEVATFHHLASVRRLCTSQQQEVFDNIILNLFKHLPEGPPPGGREGPPHEGGPDGGPPDRP